MAIIAISNLRRDPALANASGLLAGATGQKGDSGPAGPAGQAGASGAAGRGISSVATDNNNHLIVTFTDGSTQDIGPVTVPPPSGADGGTF
jgi:hypothetical protein